MSEKMFETLAILNGNLEYCFLQFYFFFVQEKRIFSCGRISFYRQHTVAGIEGHEVTPFFKFGLFYKMIGQNKTKGITKIFWLKMLELEPGQVFLIWRVTLNPNYFICIQNFSKY
jgi:hypothetical protein